MNSWGSINELFTEMKLFIYFPIGSYVNLCSVVAAILVFKSKPKLTGEPLLTGPPRPFDQ